MAQSPTVLKNAEADPLAQLRDIHLPAALELWPPAPGWWILAALAVAALLVGIWFLFRRWQKQAYRRESLKELETLYERYVADQDHAAYLSGYSGLLKRVALTRYPRAEVASLSGEAWVRFLDESANTDEFSMGAGQALVASGYQREALVDVARLHTLARFWIKEHKDLERAA